MTTKWKIVTGFVVMLLVLSTVAAIGYTSLTGATEAFTEYRRLARFNTFTSDLLSNQYASSAAVRLFRIEARPEILEEARSAIRANQKVVEEALGVTRLKETRDSLTAARESAVEQFRLFDELQKTVQASMDTYEKVIQPAARNFTAGLASLGMVGFTANNGPGVKTVLQTLVDMSSVRSSASRLAFSRTQANADRLAEVMATLTKDMDALKGVLTTDAGRAAYAEILALFNEMAKASELMRQAATDAVKSNATLLDLNGRLKKSADDVSHTADTLSARQGEKTVRVNETAKETMIGGAGIGALVSILVAGFILIGLVRTLHGMRDFAQAVARGDFQAQMASREKGEVGETLAAMRQIPETLKGIVQSAVEVSTAIRRGKLDTHLDVSRFAGEFSDLAKSVNVVGESYNNIINHFPPFMSCDKDTRILYLNKAAQTVLGGDFKGRACSGLLNAPECNTANCVGRQAMEKGSIVAETQVHPQGKAVDVSVAGTPLMDGDTAVGFYEILTDITEIKKQQRTIKSVADKAASISNRVATASEELSAQVEQVSRGAETQRTRVESTASAMTEMNSTVMEVAKNAGQASEQSETTKNKANDGANLVNKVVQSINQVNKVAATLQTNMQELGKQAENIGGVMNVISDIADQTNLLALNAAIEAARAGEAGRGFAVVADEVRKLAEKTMSATQEVGANITAIQRSARTNIDEVNTAASAIAEATDLSNTSGRALNEIVNLASANSSVVTSIATAAEEQSATSEEISHSIEEISHIVNETTDGMVQASSAVQELSKMAQELNRVMKELE
jgi:methyl-accepting chemotaxis protein